MMQWGQNKIPVGSLVWVPPEHGQGSTYSHRGPACIINLTDVMYSCVALMTSTHATKLRFLSDSFTHFMSYVFIYCVSNMLSVCDEPRSHVSVLYGAPRHMPIETSISDPYAIDVTAMCHQCAIDALPSWFQRAFRGTALTFYNFAGAKKYII